MRTLVIDGERRSFEVVERPVEGGMIGLARDTTESAQVADELGWHIAGHATVLGQLGTSVAICGPDRRLRFFNRAFADLFRLDESRLSAEPLQEDLIEWLREDRLISEQADFQAYKSRFTDMFTTLIEPAGEIWSVVMESPKRHSTRAPSMSLTARGPPPMSAKKGGLLM